MLQSPAALRTRDPVPLIVGVARSAVSLGLRGSDDSMKMYFPKKYMAFYRITSNYID